MVGDLQDANERIRTLNNYATLFRRSSPELQSLILVPNFNDLRKFMDVAWLRHFRNIQLRGLISPESILLSHETPIHWPADK